MLLRYCNIGFCSSIPRVNKFRTRRSFLAAETSRRYHHHHHRHLWTQAKCLCVRISCNLLLLHTCITITYYIQNLFLSAVFAVARCLSVHPSVRLSRSCVCVCVHCPDSRWMKILSISFSTGSPIILIFWLPAPISNSIGDPRRCDSLRLLATIIQIQIQTHSAGELNTRRWEICRRRRSGRSGIAGVGLGLAIDLTQNDHVQQTKICGYGHVSCCQSRLLPKGGGAPQFWGSLYLFLSPST